MFGAGVGFTLLRLGAGIIGGGQCLFGGLGGGGCGLQLFLSDLKRLSRLFQRLTRGGHGIARDLGLGVMFGHGFRRVLHHPVRGLVPRGQTGHVLGQLRQGGFAVLQHGGSILCGLQRGLKRVVEPVTRLGQLILFPFQTFDRFTRIAVQAGFTVDIKAQLFDPRIQRLNRRARLFLLVRQGVTLNDQAL